MVDIGDAGGMRQAAGVEREDGGQRLDGSGRAYGVAGERFVAPTGSATQAVAQRLVDCGGLHSVVGGCPVPCALM